jgi:U3 small nucleolar RNA-associated protein 18
MQFERLNPKPEWAIQAEKRRRRKSEAASSDYETSGAEDMDVDDDELSAQPLAQLLKGADTLTRGNETGPRKRRKLQPEVINIQPMKDIAGELPVRLS